MEDDPLVHTRGNDCSLAEFKTWATAQFSMTEARERITNIVVSSERDGESGVAVDTEVVWKQALKDASALHLLEPITVQCITEVEEDARGQGIQNRTHFRDLDFSLRSVDSSEKPKAYGLSHERSPAEASVLITSALGNAVEGMLVNRIPGTNITSADLNFEATNPFEGQTDEFGAIQTPAFDAVQKWLATPKPRFQNLSAAQRDLRAILGTNAEIVERLPSRRSEDTANIGQARKGDVHKPH
jgi:hypothetical protein